MFLFKSGDAPGKVYFPGGNGRVAPIDPGDVAPVAGAVLTLSRHEGEIYELNGPELHTIDDMAQITSRAPGKSIKYINFPLFAARMQMRLAGVDKILVGGLIEVADALRTDRGAQLTDTVRQVTGTPPRTFEAWCRENIEAIKHI